MELITLKKEYAYLKDESEKLFLNISNADSNMNIIEEYYIKGAELKIRRAFIDSYDEAAKYATIRQDHRARHNSEGRSPYAIKINGKVITSVDMSFLDQELA